MDFIRKIVRRKMLAGLIDLPGEIQGNMFELIILPFETTSFQKKKFDPDQYKGVLSLDRPERDIEDLRNEWGRI